MIIDVDEAITLANDLARINRLNDLTNVEFHYDGQIIDVPAAEIEEWEFIGLNTMDFILNRDWPENPAYSTDDKDTE